MVVAPRKINSLTKQFLLSFHVHLWNFFGVSTFHRYLVRWLHALPNSCGSYLLLKVDLLCKTGIQLFKAGCSFGPSFNEQKIKGNKSRSALSQLSACRKKIYRARGAPNRASCDHSDVCLSALPYSYISYVPSNERNNASVQAAMLKISCNCFIKLRIARYFVPMRNCWVADKVTKQRSHITAIDLTDVLWLGVHRHYYFNI